MFTTITVASLIAALIAAFYFIQKQIGIITAVVAVVGCVYSVVRLVVKMLVNTVFDGIALVKRIKNNKPQQ